MRARRYFQMKRGTPFMEQHCVKIYIFRAKKRRLERKRSKGGYRNVFFFYEKRISMFGTVFFSIQYSTHLEIYLTTVTNYRTSLCTRFRSRLRRLISGQPCVIGNVIAFFFFGSLSFLNNGWIEGKKINWLQDEGGAHIMSSSYSNVTKEQGSILQNWPSTSSIFKNI